MGFLIDTETAGKRVRASDPVSSVQAAQQTSASALSHSERILAALSLHAALTADEMARMTGLTVVQIDRRLPELARAAKARVVQHKDADMLRKGFRVWEAV